MPTQTPDPNLDPKIPRRFSESNTAFNALSRDLGVNWQERFGPKRLALVAQGKASPKETLDHPQDALFHYAFSEGFDRVNVLTANWGSGKSNRGGLLWEPPLDLPTEALAHRCQDPAILTREATRVALLCGAVAVGVTELDPRWIYFEVQRNHCSTGEPETKPIEIANVPYPAESDEALLLPKTLKRVIVMAAPMDRRMIATAPSLLAEAATSLGYSDAARAAVSLAAYVRSLGYQAVPSLNGTALSVPLAWRAGLGEVGRNGLLLTPERGACVRLSKVFTDMPLQLGEHADLGIRAYCQTCDACARACPAQAISHGPPTHEGHNECNQSGVLKWHVDAKRCLRYWISSGTSCSACIASCPFTLGSRWGLGLPRWVIRRTRRFNRALTWLDQRREARKRVDSSRYLAETPLAG